MRWVGHAARMEDVSLAERIILRWIFRKWDVGTWSVLMWLRIGIGRWDL
jgi:hypothetical protein